MQRRVAGFGWAGLFSSLRWLASPSHKDIWLAYVVSALLGGVVGTTLSSLLRSEVYESASRFDAASFSPDPLYNGLITAHAVFQIFFMVMPALFGGYGSWMVPVLLGSPDTAFPRLNNISFWLTPQLRKQGRPESQPSPSNAN